MGNRRSFLQKTIGALLIFPIVNACKTTISKIVLKLTGTKYSIGHRLWSKDFPSTTKTESVKIVIVGGGISGLSAARALSQRGIEDFILLELDDHIGGNSSNGENRYSKYPRGAHYLPLPNKDDEELIRFLEEEKIIVGYKDGMPQFDEHQLSFPPQERLFYKGSWQEDLVPKSNIGTPTSNQFERFFKEMKGFRERKDDDGKFWFNLPISKASQAPEVLALDQQTMGEWLSFNDFKSDELLWYVDYCCRDDYGVGIDIVSAWAGIHYFAARKQDYGQQYKNNVLTWPEGNAHLAHLLSKFSKDKTRKNSLVFDVNLDFDSKVKLSVYDAITNKSATIVAEKVIMATPQYVNQYLFPERKRLEKSFAYAPWIVAAITLSLDFDGDEFPLAWDNVIYGSSGLGYIYNQQQSIAQMNNCKVISYYLPFPDKDIRKSRRALYRQKESYWQQLILDDLRKAHPEIETSITEIEIFRLGHGMVSPIRGFVTGEAMQEARKPIGNKIFFAHTDLSGISVFEEGFYQGINAVNKMLG